MKIELNGRDWEVEPAISIAELVKRATHSTTVAVARNEVVVPRGEWTTTAVHEGDRIELLAPHGGG